MLPIYLNLIWFDTSSNASFLEMFWSRCRPHGTVLLTSPNHTGWQYSATEYAISRCRLCEQFWRYSLFLGTHFFFIISMTFCLNSFLDMDAILKCEPRVSKSFTICHLRWNMFCELALDIWNTKFTICFGISAAFCGNSFRFWSVFSAISFSR